MGLVVVRTIAVDLATDAIAETLGRQGEHCATKLVLDGSSFKALWPAATYNVSILRYGDDSPYVALLGARLDENGKIEYNLSETDTAVAGLIRLMVTVVQAEQVCKTCVFLSRIERSLEDGGALDEEARPDWVKRLLTELAAIAAGAQTASIYNALDKSTSGFSLDARQGLTLKTLIDELYPVRYAVQDLNDAQKTVGRNNLAAAKATSGTVTLPTSGYSGTYPYTYMASLAAVKANNMVIASPAPANKTAYEDCGAYASSQAEGSLTFTVTGIPTAAITVNVIVIDP